MLRGTYDANQDGGAPGFHGRPLVTSDLIVIGSDDRRPDGVGHVYAFHRKNLKPAWKYRAGPGVMTDVVRFGRTVFVVTLADELIAIDLHAGAVRWTFRSGTLNPQFAVNSTPVVVTGRVIFGGLNGMVYGLDVRSGAVVWQRDLGAKVSTSVAGVGDDVFLGDASGYIHRLDVTTGASEAQLHIDGDLISKLFPVDESILAFANVDGVTTLMSLPLNLKSVSWTRAAPGEGWSSFAWPYVWKLWVVAGTATGHFFGIRLDDGRLDWEGRIAGAVAGIAGDKTAVYLGTGNGILYCYPLPVAANFGRRR